jgi:hypothetical protein
MCPTPASRNKIDLKVQLLVILPSSRGPLFLLVARGEQKAMSPPISFRTMFDVGQWVVYDTESDNTKVCGPITNKDFAYSIKKT